MKHEHETRTAGDQPDQLPVDPNAPPRPDNTLPTDPDAPPRPERPEKAPKAPELGTIVHYAGEDGLIHPAMVVDSHEDGTVDLRIELGYAQGSTDKKNVKESEEGEAGSYLPVMSAEEREHKISAALKKKAKEHEKAAAEAKKEQDRKAQEDAHSLANELADLQKRTIAAQKRAQEQIAAH